jgi:hypothetical protein
MDNDVFFNKFVTKDLHPIGGDQRFFEGYLTVQVKDKQGEITIVDELIKVLPIWMDRGAPISDTHSNRIIGKGISYAKTVYKSVEGDEYPAIKITGKIHKDYHLDDEIWGKIKSGEYKGLSFGGATKADRTPKIMKDGSVAYELKSLEHYEVAVCKDPAVPLALITDYNPLAKAMTDNIEVREDGKMVIKCDKFGCTVDKAEDFSNADGDRTNLYNQDVEPDKSSNRESSPVNDDSDVEIKTEEKKDDEDKEEDDKDKKKAKGDYCPHCGDNKKENDSISIGGACPNCGHGFEEKKKDANLHYGGVRHSSKEYNNHAESTQVTEVKEEEEDDEKKDEDKKDDDTKKSGYQTEDGNNQLGGQGAPKEKEDDDKDEKDNENYINSETEESDKDMENNTESKNDESYNEVDKSDFQEAIKSNISVLTDVIKSLAETQKDVSTTLVSIEDRLKALETPTDLPLKPSVSATEDVGAKVTVPDTYQSNSVQAGLDDDKSGEDKPKTDPSGLKMQEKSNFDFTTETPRPNAAIDSVNKSAQSDMSYVLKDAREGGNLSVVARNILAGKYYTPTPDEVGTY